MSYSKREPCLSIIFPYGAHCRWTFTEFSDRESKMVYNDGNVGPLTELRPRSATFNSRDRLRPIATSIISRTKFLTLTLQTRRLIGFTARLVLWIGRYRKSKRTNAFVTFPFSWWILPRHRRRFRINNLLPLYCRRVAIREFSRRFSDVNCRLRADNNNVLGRRVMDGVCTAGFTTRNEIRFLFTFRLAL